MPVHVIEATDAITSMIQFRTSAVYEMIVSLHSLSSRRRHHEWASTATAALGPAFIDELHTMYAPAHDGAFLFEFPVDYDDHADVPGFIDYVREMDSATFTFYLIGRVIPRADLAAHALDPDYIVASFKAIPFPCFPELPLREILQDIRGYQARLVRLWETYWNTFFHSQVAELPAHWSKGLADKENILAASGGRGLLEAVTGKTAVFEALPADQPTTEIVFVPVFFSSYASYVFFGYGNETVLFDSERTETRISELNEGKEWALGVAKALADNTRLNILRLIAQHEGRMHGKSIASHLKLSPSAVSRQLSQLRDCGLIVEEHHDDQTVTYRMVSRTLSSFPGKILDYLYS